MIEVPIINSKYVALIDDADAKLVLQHKWYLYIWRAPTLYVQMWTGKMMHQLLIPETGGLIRHHRNTNGLDNRRDNLELISTMENLQIKRRYDNNKTGHTGVKFNTRLQKYEAQITSYGKRIYLGVFKNIEDAIAVRQEAEKAMRTK